MSRCVDQKIGDSAFATEPKDVTMCNLGDVTHITVTDGARFMRAIGTRNPDFLNGLVSQVGNAGSKGEYPDELGIKFMLAFIKGHEPRNEVQAAMAAQMAATHVAVMRYANRLARAESLQEQDSAERGFNKLARTFVTQVEALQRYRVVCEQKITASEVSVGNDGQPIVGAITQQAHETNLRKAAPAKPELAAARRPPMEIIGKPQRAPLPLRRRKNHGRQLSA